MLEELLTMKGGAPAILSSIAVLLSLQLLAKVGEFTWTFIKKKSELSEKGVERLTEALGHNTHAMEKLESRINEVERDLSEIPKFRTDLRRLYAATKILAGDKWPGIRNEVMADEPRDA